jgi:hypothetical protein
MSWQDDALTRLASIIEYGDEKIDYGTTQGFAHFQGWRIQAVSALHAIVGDDNIYSTEFEKHVDYNDGPYLGIEILRRLHSDI